MKAYIFSCGYQSLTVTIAKIIDSGNNNVPSTQLKPNTRGTRGNGKKFHQIYAGTNYYKFSFFPMLVPLWNALPSNVVLAVDLEGFKDALTKVHIKSIYPN